MLGFGEKYTKEAYDEAAADERENQASLDNYHPDNSFSARYLMNDWQERANKAHKRVNELYGKSEKEARKLNEEYDQLLAKARAAWGERDKFEEKIAKFEKEKLGMHQEK
jgi:hypothetical protein